MENCVITGMGALCSIGKNVDEIWDRIVKGLGGIKEIQEFNTAGCMTSLGAEIDNFKAYSKVEVEDSDKMDRVSHLLIRATEEALKDSKLDIKLENVDRIATIIGSCTGGILSCERVARSYIEGEEIKQADIFGMSMNCLGSNIAKQYDLKGYISNIGNACSASLVSIARGCELIKSGDVDIVIAGGGDTISPVTFSGFNALQSLDKEPCSPFSRSKGISLGEGAGIVIIESERHALKRNATIYAYITGYSITSDAYHITSPREDSASQIVSIRQALKMASLEDKDIDYISAHGTGTPTNDRIEKETLEKVFGKNKDNLSVSSNKSFIGHCLGASGVLGAILSVKALQDQIVPPTINFLETNDMQFDFVPNHSKKKKMDNILVNAFAFGGNNSSVILSKSGARKEEKRNTKKVLITGIGVLLPNINGKDDYINNKDAVDKSHQISNIKFEDFGVESNKVRRLDSISKFSILSSLMALKDSNLNITEDNSSRIGISFGTSEGPMNTCYAFANGMVKNGISKGSAFIFPNTVPNAAAGYVSIFTGIKGYTTALVDGFHAGISAIIESFDVVKNNLQSNMLCIGADENSELIRASYDNIGLIGKNGVKISEGSVSLVISNEDNIVPGEQKIYGEVLGYSILSEPTRVGALPDNLYRLKDVILCACEKSGIGLQEITHVEGFNNGDMYMKDLEIKLYKETFKSRFDNINLNFVRQKIGESRAAASLMQIVNGIINNKPGENKTILVTGYANGGVYSAVIIRA